MNDDRPSTGTARLFSGLLYLVLVLLVSAAGYAGWILFRYLDRVGV